MAAAVYFLTQPSGIALERLWSFPKVDIFLPSELSGQRKKTIGQTKRRFHISTLVARGATRQQYPSYLNHAQLAIDCTGA